MELSAAPRAIPGMTTLDPRPAAGTDAELIGRSIGEPHAFGLLFDRHMAAVHAFTQRRVGRDLAEEVTAETFARGFEARSRYDLAQEDALPWLLGIAGNVLRRHWRSERRRLAAYARAAKHERPGAAPDVDGAMMAAVARLPRRQREVLLLAAWADLTYAEVARALDLPIGTVRSRLARARSRLGAETAPEPARPLISPLDDVKEPSRV
jgi:RNA polymerase sigma-70 factor (ECF subfamily)